MTTKNPVRVRRAAAVAAAQSRARAVEAKAVAREAAKEVSPPEETARLYGLILNEAEVSKTFGLFVFAKLTCLRRVLLFFEPAP